MSAQGWQKRPLGKCAKFLSGGTPNKARSEFWDGDIPWVSSGEMADIRIHDTPLHISAQGAEEGSRLVPPNTVLVVVRGMSLAKEFRVAITKREVAFNQDLKAFQCEPDVEPEFLYYSLLANRDRIRDLSTEASHGTKRLQTEVLEAYEILVPKPNIQRRAVSLLSAYDELIENNRRRMELLGEAARQLYREWFVRLRFPGCEHTQLVNRVPEGWERLTLDEALVLQRGFDLPIQEREEGGVPIYGSTGISGFHSRAMVKGPGVVTGRSGTLGVVHYVAEDFWPLNTALWVREFKRVSPIYAFFMLQEMALEQYNGGVSVPTLDRKAAHRLFVVIPRRQLIQLLDEYVGPMMEMIQKLRRQSQKLRAARDLLLPRLMSGEIAV